MDLPGSSVSPKLTGNAKGTPGNRNNSGNYLTNAFDSSLATLFESPIATGWKDQDLGIARSITTVKFAAHADYTSSMVGGYFQASNVADFSTATPIHTISTAPIDGVLNSVNVSVSGTWRYVRYFGPASSYINIAELEFWGY